VALASLASDYNSLLTGATLPPDETVEPMLANNSKYEKLTSTETETSDRKEKVLLWSQMRA